MAEWIADISIQNFLKKSNNQVNTPVQCLIAGVTYKSNCPDVRNTKVVDIAHSLKRYGVDVDLWDPIADKISFESEYDLTLIDSCDLVNSYNIIIVAVSHDIFKSIQWSNYASDDSIVVDIKNILGSDHNILKL